MFKWVKILYYSDFGQNSAKRTWWLWGTLRMVGEGRINIKMLFWDRLKRKFILLLIYSWGSPENAASCFNSETCNIMLICSRLYQECCKALSFYCKGFLCKFCPDCLMKYGIFSKPNKDWSPNCILRVFGHAVSWMTITLLDYWSKFGNHEEQERNCIYIIVLHENVELSSQMSSNVN